MASSGMIATVLKKRAGDLQTQWLKELSASGSNSAQGRITADELDQQSKQFLQLLSVAAQGKNPRDLNSPESRPLREFLEALSQSRAQQGFTSGDTASFIFSFKRPLFDALRAESGSNASALADEVWAATELLDALGLHTVSTF